MKVYILEAVDPDIRDKRIAKLRGYATRAEKKANGARVVPDSEKGRHTHQVAKHVWRGALTVHDSGSTVGSGIRADSAVRAHKLKNIIKKHRIPGKLRNQDMGKVTFSQRGDGFGKQRRREPVHSTLAWLKGYMHNPGASMHVARKRKDGSTKYYKTESLLNLLEKRSKDRKKISKKAAFLRSLYRD